LVSSSTAPAEPGKGDMPVLQVLLLVVVVFLQPCANYENMG